MPVRVKRAADVLFPYSSLYFTLFISFQALRLDEAVAESLVSSSVDHVFFVLRKSAEHALLSSNLNALCATLNVINSTLNRDYIDVLSRLLQENATRTAASVLTRCACATITRLSLCFLVCSALVSLSLLSLQGHCQRLCRQCARDPEQHRGVCPLSFFFSRLSLFLSFSVFSLSVARSEFHVQVSCEYIGKLRQEVEQEAAKVFSGLDARLVSCLDDLTETAKTCQGILQVCRELPLSLPHSTLLSLSLFLLTPSLSPASSLIFAFQTHMESVCAAVAQRVKPLLDPMTSVSYELTETEFAEREVNDPWVQQCVANMDAILAPYKVRAQDPTLIVLQTNMSLSHLPLCLCPAVFSYCKQQRVVNSAASALHHLSH